MECTSSFLTNRRPVAFTKRSKCSCGLLWRELVSSSMVPLACIWLLALHVGTLKPGELHAEPPERVEIWRSPTSITVAAPLPMSCQHFDRLGS